MNYRESLTYLDGLNVFGVRLGLARIKRLLELLGTPQDRYRTIHVTGTNGKGSVSAMLATILQQSSIRTGLYISPHLVSYTERMQIDGQPISEAEFAACLTAVREKIDEMMAEGLLDEVKRLLPYRHENALNTVGYKELFAYLDGTYSLEEAVERIKGNTRRYARKQLTWFKRDETMTWFHPDDEEAIIRFIQTQTSNQNNLTINKCLTVRHEESFHH